MEQEETFVRNAVTEYLTRGLVPTSVAVHKRFWLWSSDSVGKKAWCLLKGENFIF